MIISHKYKFIFIGLPFSASSAISKELHEKYEGKPFLRKHSLYHEFKKNASKKEQEYFVFSVIRNPMEIAITIYEKMKSNAKGNFTNPELFTENGGHITKEQRRKFKYIKNNNPTFQKYFLKFYKMPFDNFARLTLEKCDYVIRYENIQSDYLKALRMAGVKNPRPLPIANKTSGKKENNESYYTNEIRKRSLFVFGPFFKKYNYHFPKDWNNKNISHLSIILFNIIGFLKEWKWKLKKQSNRKSIKGSIYGDMQRKF